MRRFLAILGLILVTGGFIMIPVSIWKNISFLIPVVMILASFLILLLVKNMDSPETTNEDSADTEGK